MLNRIVPTPDQQPEPLLQLLLPSTATGGLALASISKTSRSGRLNFVMAFQLRPSSSWNWFDTPPSRLNLTMMPTSGRLVLSVLLWGGGVPPGEAAPAMLQAGSTMSLSRLLWLVVQRWAALMPSVWLPEWKMAA